MPKILVIDDDSIVREEIAGWLGIAGFEVVSAEDGLVGVKYAYNHVPSLIVCDITMPDLDGYGVLMEIRANPATADTPVIFLTTQESEAEIRVGTSIGASDFISRPFTQEQLLNAIQTRLQKKEAKERVLKRQVELLERALTQEHEQRLLRAKLVAMFAHDFRNPLASIVASNSLMRDFADRLDEKRRVVHMNRIDASVNYLLNMLDEMLILAQIDCGSLEFSPEPLTVGPFLQAIVDEFQSIYGATHQIIYECFFTDDTMLDPRLLQQIASNLISNAIKYSPPGTEVRVFAEKDDQQIMLTVQDHGIGIPEVDQLDFFTAFKRGSNVGHTPGTGLGMAIVKQALDLQGGSVRFESHLGTGTTFIITLPMMQR